VTARGCDALLRTNDRNAMLVILILLAWLGIVLIVVALCSVSARSELEADVPHEWPCEEVPVWDDPASSMPATPSGYRQRARGLSPSSTPRPDGGSFAAT
jgi:hypothetical protein